MFRLQSTNNRYKASDGSLSGLGSLYLSSYGGVRPCATTSTLQAATAELSSFRQRRQDSIHAGCHCVKCAVVTDNRPRQAGERGGDSSTLLRFIFNCLVIVYVRDHVQEAGLACWASSASCGGWLWTQKLTLPTQRLAYSWRRVPVLILLVGWLVEVLLYVHRNRRLIRDGSPGRPPRLSHSS